MATAQGEVRFEAGGATHLLVFGINALCALEDEFDCSIEEIGTKLSGTAERKVRLSDLRQIFRAGLIEHWPEGEPTVKEAGAIFTELGMARGTELLEEAFIAAFPDAVSRVDGKSPGNARKK